ncbi:MAG: L-Proline/Glycine betaine transporter ProP [Hydrocarboniphaga sp.]|uniref:MFS transporter n=1 Tax=Hydrocarboniphaga sp. TaxID=2033016 RepID=UPI00261AA68C|nr:MFS transporter [Hydrocarboniphaga sp.]MDB5969650.1 L-Proline/Glycine betaine transporter ProP [Hydrocarboniphaga sp.]
MNPAADRPLDRRDLRTLGLAALGGALEFYDFVIFVFFAVIIGKLFFPPDTPEWLRQLQTYGLFAAGYLARPIGGIVMAHYGDRIGRKKMFTLSVFLMSLPTLALGLLPTYASVGYAAPLLLLVMRLLQGAAIGGEIPGAWVFVSEHVPERRVGFACSALTAGLTAGILLGSLVASAINLSFTQAEILDHVWRLPFLLGGVFGLIAVWLRRWLHETPIFEAMRLQKQLSQELPLKAVLRDHWRAVVGSMLLTWTLTAAIVVVILMTPTLIQKMFAVPAPQALFANSVATLCLTIGCLIYGLAADRFGGPRVLLIGCFALLGSTWALYSGLAHGTLPLLPAYAVAGFCVAIVGVIPSLIVRAFPAAVRFSGLSFSYNMAYAIFGGLTPLLVSLALKLSPQFAPAWYVGALCLLCSGFVAIRYFLLPPRVAPAGLTA